MLLKTMLVAAALLCFAVTAAAATDREVLQNKLATIAPPAEKNPKGLCFCLSTSADFQGRVGTIRQTLVSNQVFVRCFVDTFDTAGNDIAGFVCSTFTPLAK